MNKYRMLSCLFVKRALNSFVLCIVMMLALATGIFAHSEAVAAPPSLLGATKQAKQDFPMAISFELVSLHGALDENFLAQYLQNDGVKPESSAKASASKTSSAPEKNAVIVWIEPQTGYHAYAHKPLITTRPTTVTLLQNGQAVATQILYPAGVLTQDIFEPSKEVMVYEGRTPIAMALPPTLDAQGHGDVTIKVSGLLCSDSNCWPFDEELTVTGLPHTEGGTAEFIREDIQTIEDTNINAVLQEWNVTPRYASPGLEVTGLGKALLFGLLAGLILNLMPCVLPVLGFKLSAFIAAAGQQGDQNERVRAFREHNIFFALGILAWFLVLALVLSWAGLAWGQLFQQTPILMGLMLIVFLLALSMFGVFTLPVLDIKASSSGSPRMQAFMTGAVATLLATPCSGPLLGGVLGWAFGQSPFILAMVFVAVGLGMASPYIALSIWPKLVHKVPRAGAWTGIVEQGVGFFLMATALYLWTILPQDVMMPSMYTLFVAAFCAWIWGRWSGPAASTLQRIVIRVCAIVIIVAMAIWSLSPKQTDQALWQSFDAAEVHALLGNEPLVLEFTADWCPNCKVLERTTLTHDNVQAWTEDYGARFIRVDLTRQESANNAAAEALLHALGSRSIPLVALFPEGAEYARPLVLRDIFTPSQMDAALEEAFGE